MIYLALVLVNLFHHDPKKYFVGFSVGLSDGAIDCAIDGILVGYNDGLYVGAILGTRVGVCVSPGSKEYLVCLLVGDSLGVFDEV